MLEVVHLMYLGIKRDASRFIHRTCEVNSEWKSLRQSSGEQTYIMRLLNELQEEMLKIARKFALGFFVWLVG